MDGRADPEAPFVRRNGEDSGLFPVPAAAGPGNSVVGRSKGASPSDRKQYNRDGRSDETEAGRNGKKNIWKKCLTSPAARVRI